MNKVTLNQEEAQWFSRNVLKMISLLETQGTRDPEILKRSTYKVLHSMQMQAVFAGNSVERTDLMLSKKQKLIVKELIQSVTKTLVDRILPEYARRGGHEEYIERGKKKAEWLEAMARKFK